MNPTKLGLHFSDFSTIFYGIYKNQQNTLYYLRIYLSRRPLELSNTSQICPWFTKTTLERSGSPQLGPWGRPPAVLAGFWRGGGRGRWGEGGRTTGGSPRGGMRVGLGLGGRGRGCTAAQGGGVRGGEKSGEARAVAGRQVAG
jgi:hypothetical protein